MAVYWKRGSREQNRLWATFLRVCRVCLQTFYRAHDGLWTAKRVGFLRVCRVSLAGGCRCCAGPTTPPRKPNMPSTSSHKAPAKRWDCRRWSDFSAYLVSVWHARLLNSRASMLRNLVSRNCRDYGIFNFILTALQRIVKDLFLCILFFRT